MAKGKDIIAYGTNSTALGENDTDFEMYSIFTPLATSIRFLSSNTAEISNRSISTISLQQASILWHHDYNGDQGVCSCIEVLETNASSTTIRCEKNTFPQSLINDDHISAIIICLGTAYGAGSYIEGQATTAIDNYQHVQGKYNKPESNMAHIVGNGSREQLSNAHTLDWEGNAWFAGDVILKSGHKLSEKVNSSQIAPMVNNVIANTLSEKTTLKIYFDDNTYSEFEVYQNNSKQNIEY